jgi:hypothetical protein
MDADHVVDDELQARQSDPRVGGGGEGKGPVRVAHVHHDLDRDVRHMGHLDDLMLEGQGAFVDEAGIALGTGDGDGLAFADLFGGIDAAHHRRHA